MNYFCFTVIVLRNFLLLLNHDVDNRKTCPTEPVPRDRTRKMDYSITSFEWLDTLNDYL